MKVYLGADHAGFDRKEKLKKELDSLGYTWIDLGPKKKKPKDDYVDYAVAVGERVAKEKNAMGILVCGSGTGMVIAANKVRGVRAAEAYDLYTARMSRKDNDANVLGLRTRGFPMTKIRSIVKAWLTTPFSGLVRHKRRIKKIKAYEAKTQKRC